MNKLLKKLLSIIFMFTLTIVFTTACSAGWEYEEMDMMEKMRYAERFGFSLLIYVDGEWIHFYGNQLRGTNTHIGAQTLVRLDSEGYSAFYTEVRFVHNWDEAWDFPNTVIVGIPFERPAVAAVNAINWEAASSGLDLSEFGLTYPVTIENLVDDYVRINGAVSHDPWFRGAVSAFANNSVLVGEAHGAREWQELQERIEAGTATYMFSPDSRVEFELTRMDGSPRDHIERVNEILEQLGMDHDEGGQLLHTAGSTDAFFAVTDLILTQGLSAEEALAQYRRNNR
jgi:hypothetical protein